MQVRIGSDAGGEGREGEGGRGRGEGGREGEMGEKEGGEGGREGERGGREEGGEGREGGERREEEEGGRGGREGGREHSLHTVPQAGTLTQLTSVGTNDPDLEEVPEGSERLMWFRNSMKRTKLAMRLVAHTINTSCPSSSNAGLRTSGGGIKGRSR